MLKHFTNCKQCKKYKGLLRKVLWKQCDYLALISCSDMIRVTLPWYWSYSRFNSKHFFSLMYGQHDVKVCTRLWNLFVVPVCNRPEVGANIQLDGLQRFFSPGEEIALNCKHGYTPVSGPRKIVCRANGEWTTSRLLCIGGSLLL